MLGKANPKDIIKDHLKVLYDNRTGKISWLDFSLFYGLPIIISVFLTYYLCPGKSQAILEKTITGISVFSGFLINILILIDTLVSKEKEKRDAFIARNRELKILHPKRNLTKFDSKRLDILNEMIVTIHYSVLVALLFLLVYFISYLFTVDSVLFSVFIGAAFFLLINFFLTVMMILKRSKSIIGL